MHCQQPTNVSNLTSNLSWKVETEFCCVSHQVCQAVKVHTVLLVKFSTDCIEGTSLTSFLTPQSIWANLRKIIIH